MNDGARCGRDGASKGEMRVREMETDAQSRRGAPALRFRRSSSSLKRGTLGTMLEAVFLLLLVFLLPRFDLSPLWAIVALLLVLPGVYATWTGAPFIPSSKRTVKRMLDAANLKPGEKIYDLGCGDGRIVFAAAGKGARAVGYEYSIPTYLLAKFRSLFHRRSSVRFADFWAQDYRDADVIFCYLLKDTMQVFQKRVWPQLRPGTRVISHAFRMRGIKPVHEEEGIVMYRK